MTPSTDVALEQLETWGAYTVAGYVDIYHAGRHKRLAEVGTDGLRLTADGDAFVAAMMVPQIIDLLTPDASEEVIDNSAQGAPGDAPPVPRQRKKAATAAALVVPADIPEAGIDALDDILGG
jgi:hypothetical protein